MARRELGSWMTGPTSALDDDTLGYPGEALGLPEHGPGSIAGFGRRLTGLFIDWMVAYGIAELFLWANGGKSFLGGEATLPLLFWFVGCMFSVAIMGRTLGHAVMGIGVARVDHPGAAVGWARAFFRQFFTSFVITAVVTDIDQRGLHDRTTGTAVIRTR